MTVTLGADFESLYAQAWEELRELRKSCPEVDREATPILAFGQWSTARVVTAGLNPSEDEFRDKSQVGPDGLKTPLKGTRQRFLHWPKAGLLTRELREEAFRRAEGYFKLGNAYEVWFSAYNEFLSAMGATFVSGNTCHTDYVSPFATVKGVSNCGPTTIARLELTGFHYWVRVLELCPCIEVIFGHGRGWRMVEKYFRVKLVDLSTPFDHKGGSVRHLSWASVRLPESKRRVLLYWWHPNRYGLPLCWLSRIEKRELGEMLKRDVQKKSSGFASNLDAAGKR